LESPVIVDDLMILNIGSAGVALNKQNGEIVWESGQGTSGYASAVPFEKDGIKSVAMFGKDSLQIIDADTGKVTASYEWKTSYNVNAADPVVSGDEILITSGYGHGAALLKRGPEGLSEVWKSKKMRSQMSGPVLIDGYLYGFDDNKLVCLDWKTGEQKWSEKSPKKGSLSAAGDKLIVIGEKGELLIAEATPQGYQQIASAQVLDGRCWTMPVLSKGRIYVRNAKGHLVCVDVQKKKIL
jgi:outer membrane protein assembly factor BamB